MRRGVVAKEALWGTFLEKVSPCPSKNFGNVPKVVGGSFFQ
jgi:hypothetical protein